MKFSKKALSVCLVLAVAVCVSASFGTGAKQQQSCVNCAVSNGVFVCQGAAAGGKECQTLGPTGCSISDPCTTKKGPKRVGTEVPLDPEFYRAVAVQHARFAASLLLYTRGKTALSDGVVYWMPFEMTQADVEQMMGSDQNMRDVLSQSVLKVRKDLPVIAHVVTVEESSDGSEITLTVKAAAQSALDPPYSALTVKLTPAIGPSANQAARITFWEIN